MKDKILRTINAPWFPGIFIILALIVFIMLVFFGKEQLFKSGEESMSAKGTLTVKVTGLRNNIGNVIFCLYIAPPFTDQGNITDVQVLSITDGKATAIFNDISSKDYALFVLHDENLNNYPDVDANNKLLEGIGFSNIMEARQAVPEFDEAKFYFDQDSKEIEIAVFYY